MAVTPPPESAPNSAPPDRERLSRLLHKYDTLLSLRHARAQGDPVPEKKVFRDLASEMPGALHELDRLSLDVLEERRGALQRALEGAPAAPWMREMADYHALYRAALFVKARVTRGRALSEDETATLADKASRHAGVPVQAAFVREVARPRGGRIGNVVLAETAARAGKAPSDVLKAIFPTRRDFTEGAPAPGPDVSDSMEDKTACFGEDG